ncbi:molybdopterin molybdenumtransferase MoeA [Agromyces badenianii]|uniref:Molybdopterin molybdenumtransferase n=1 Tax=Agromyces badenianii TaxID=2080742 RepID=A0A2S0WWS4_9MICO|nr:molybdopterin molybdotransferase MoeA [Agromyces badenianii]AWB95772.1 molybdopterin molybdenumtransferase MoeA [Agromyces badenianii]
MSGTGWDEARAIAWRAGAARPLGVETIPVERGDGRRLGAAVHALVDLPTVDVSAMDGWAVAGSGPWRLDGAVAMGVPPAQRLRAGTARVITTGAAVPLGTLGILRAEHGAPLPGEPEVLRAIATEAIDEGRDIRRRGEELRFGEPLIRAGARLTPPRLALAAAAGHDTLGVLATPRVDLIVTGDEVVAAGVPAPGAVRDAFTPSLPPLLGRLGAAATTRRIPDRLDPFIDAFATGRPDVFVTTGGTAGGHGDLLRRAIVAEGGTVELAGVAMRPGHPVLFARTSAGIPVLGLPGNPLAAFACLLSFLPPWLDGASGRPMAELDRVAALDIPSTGHERRLTPFEWRDGVPEPSRWRGSAMLRGLADADGFLVSPSGDGERAARMLRLPW